MAQMTIHPNYGLTTSYGSHVHQSYENYDLSSIVAEMNSLRTYIDHLEKILVDFEGRLEALEELSPEWNEDG